MKSLAICLSLATVVSNTTASDNKFVGVWEGKHGTPVYTKLVFNGGQALTYCDVSSCHYVNCMDIVVDGSVDGRFTYEDATGKWVFQRISEEEIQATFTNGAGDVSSALYEPE